MCTLTWASGATAATATQAVNLNTRTVAYTLAAGSIAAVNGNIATSTETTDPNDRFHDASVAITNTGLGVSTTLTLSFRVDKLLDDNGDNSF
jgi:hypothetical protein